MTRSPRVALALSILVLAPLAHAGRRASPVDRANAVLAQMTREEKISLAGVA